MDDLDPLYLGIIVMGLFALSVTPPLGALVLVMMTGYCASALERLRTSVPVIPERISG